MKKINPKMISLVLVIVSFLAVGGISISETIAPGSGGFAPDPDSDGG